MKVLNIIIMIDSIFEQTLHCFDLLFNNYTLLYINTHIRAIRFSDIV